MVLLLDFDEFVFAFPLNLASHKLDQRKRGLPGFDLALLEFEVGDKEGLAAVGDERNNLEGRRLVTLGRGGFCDFLGGLGGALFVLLNGFLDDVHDGVVSKEVP